MNLDELRDQWERGLTPTVELASVLSDSSMTVVLVDDDGAYHVHYYMRMTDAIYPKDDVWEVSADVQKGSAEEVVDAITMRHGAADRTVCSDCGDDRIELQLFEGHLLCPICKCGYMRKHHPVEWRKLQKVIFAAVHAGDPVPEADDA